MRLEKNSRLRPYLERWPTPSGPQKSGYDIALIRSIPDIYLFIAYSDSLIGLGLYELAKPLLFDLANSRITSNETALLCILRVLKINRCQQAQDSTSGNWTLLQKSIDLLVSVTSEALYQCFEEAKCILSAVDSLDTAQVSRAKDIIDALDAIETNCFRVSDIMKATPKEYQQKLKIYRRDFGLFSLTGPQLHYCRNIRDGFPKASIAFIERIGAASRERFQRLKERFHIDEVVEPVVTVAPSKFHDSGMGSSLQSSAMPTASPTKAPSKLSMNTVLCPGLSELLEVPTEIMTGKPYRCELCNKILKPVDPKHQWPCVQFMSICNSSDINAENTCFKIFDHIYVYRKTAISLLRLALKWSLSSTSQLMR
jgi:hypothetical protein